MTGRNRQWLVITDLDGTLLNHHDYRWQACLPAIDQLQAEKIPIVLNTSKTFAETRQIQQQLGITDPFIVENGSCLYLPVAQFPRLPLKQAVMKDGFWSVTLGKKLSELQAIIDRVSSTEDRFIRLSTCSVSQAQELTGLSKQQAADAITREFSEPLLWQSSPEKLDKFRQRLEDQQLNTLQGGRFLHVQGKTDKGLAIELLKQCYPLPVKTIVLGDSANDIAMLKSADIPVVIKSPGNPPLLQLMDPVFISSKQAPDGWNEGISHALNIKTQTEDPG